MKKNKDTVENVQRSDKGGRSFGSALFSFVGSLIIALLIASCVPVAIPKFMGYEVYNIVSGSMEPQLPVGSAIYVKDFEPQMVQKGDIIAFYVNNSVIAHRVVENDMTNRQLRTKGDANAAEDMNPISYDQVIGTVDKYIPYIGNIMLLYTSSEGKKYVIMFLLAGVMCNMLSKLFGRKREK